MDSAPIVATGPLRSRHLLFKISSVLDGGLERRQIVFQRFRIEVERHLLVGYKIPEFHLRLPKELGGGIRWPVGDCTTVSSSVFALRS